MQTPHRKNLPRPGSEPRTFYQRGVTSLLLIKAGPINQIKFLISVKVRAVIDCGLERKLPQ